MRKLRAWFLRLWGLSQGDIHDKEFAEEIESHLQMHIDDNLRCGMNPEQARREALLKLGGVESTTQGYRDGNSVPFLEALGRIFATPCASSTRIRASPPPPFLC